MPGRPVIGVDLDGTILDCAPRQQALLRHLVPQAAAYDDALWELKRDGLSTRSALEHFGITPPQDFSESWLAQIETDAYLAMDHCLPNARTALSYMAERARVFLITSRQNAPGVHHTLARLTLDVFFEEVIVVAPSNDPVGQKSAHLTSIEAKLHCGDTEVDGKAAAASHLPFWAVTCGQRSRAFLLRETTPDAIHPSLNEAALAMPL